MLLLVPSAAITLRQPAVTGEAKAGVTIERPAKASREEWERSPRSLRHEKIVRDERGNLVLMRIVEFE